MADHGHYGVVGKDESRQGIYVFTPEGKFLSSLNNLSADKVLKVLDAGLKKWNALPDAKKSAVSPNKFAPRHRWEDFYPHDGLVLNAISRDLPLDLKADSPPRSTWNRDAAWFSSDEAQKIIPLNKPVGHQFELPEFFTKRIAQFSLVDAVKGQTSPFKAEEIKGSRISGTIVSTDQAQVTIQITGATSGVHRTRGVKTNLLGKATFDREKKRFLNFEIVCIGERWGRTPFNDRRKQLESSPIGYVFQMAQPDQPLQTPGIMWAYDAPWLQRPER